MARKDYPFNKRVDKKMTNLISGLLTGLVFAPFAIMDSVPNDADIDYTKPVSKTFAVFLIIIGIALIPLFIPIISLAFQWFFFLFYWAASEFCTDIYSTSCLGCNSMSCNHVLYL